MDKLCCNSLRRAKQINRLKTNSAAEFLFSDQPAR